MGNKCGQKIVSSDLRIGDSFEKAMRPFMRQLRRSCIHEECRETCPLRGGKKGCSLINQMRLGHRGPKNPGAHHINVFKGKKAATGRKGRPSGTVSKKD